MSNNYTTPQGNNFSQSEIAPSNNLVLAIICTVACCLPLGIYAIVKASEVNSKWERGDKAGAIASANAAKKYSIIGMVAGGILMIVYLLFTFVFVATSAVSAASIS